MEGSAALRHIRARYPRATRLYLVLDNFSPHRRPEVVAWAEEHNVELVFTPTYVSWLNRIEAIFSGARTAPRSAATLECYDSADDHGKRRGEDDGISKHGSPEPKLPGSPYEHEILTESLRPVLQLTERHDAVSFEVRVAV